MLLVNRVWSNWNSTSGLFCIISVLIWVRTLRPSRRWREGTIFPFLAVQDENNQTRRSINVFNQQVSLEYRSKTEPKADLHEESVTLLEPGEHLTIFLSNEWIQIENKQRNQQKLTWHLNETNAFFSDGDQTSPLVYLRIGLNRDVYGQQTGIGLCSANLTFIECQTEPRRLNGEKESWRVVSPSRICSRHWREQ